MMGNHKQQGFTLLELIFSMILLGIISVVVGPFLLQGYKNYLTSQHILESDWQGFIAIERIANDIHTIRSFADITTIQSTQLTFVNINGNSVQYQFSGSSLLRNGLILASGIQSFNLEYLDKNGTVTATPSDVRYISISISALQGNITASFSTISALRST